MNDIAPTNFVIFGVTGDLASRYLMPSLLELYRSGMLPKNFFITGFSRRPYSRAEYEKLVTDALAKKGPEPKILAEFLAHTAYEQGNFDDPAAYAKLGQTLLALDEKFGRCSNKLFHLSVPPDLYEGILRHLSTSGLTIPCSNDTGWTRVLLEKPFGKDTESAAKLDALLGQLFKEEQIFRIDHYLAKETLQNILAFRLDNPEFALLWNKDGIESVSIELYEKLGLEGRGATFDGIGMLRDVGQNHVLQMLALVAMEVPATLDAATIRAARAEVFEHLIPLAKDAIGKKAVRAQYEGFREEKNVIPDSETETFFRLEAEIDTPRWKGVPFFLSAGKALGEQKVEISVRFKNNDKLVFRVQPNEGISLFTAVGEKKFPFPRESKASLKMNAYEKVIFDAVLGDQTLFASTEEIAASWKYITPILELWKNVPLSFYKKGAAADSIK